MGAIRLPRGVLPGVWLGVTCLMAAMPWLGADQSTVRKIILITILSLAVSGLNLSFGYAGELALGQAAVYAAGAYATAYVSVNVVNDLAVTVAASVAVSLVAGFITGVPGLRVGGWGLAIASFFLVLLIEPIINIFGDRLGGFSGFTGIPIPELFGWQLDQSWYLVVIVVVTSAWFALFRNLVTSEHGAIFRVLKASPVLTQSIGTAPYRVKLQAYAIGSIPAGIAGGFFAYLDGFIAPESFSLHLAITFLAASILGGSMSIYGVFFGATLIQLGPLQSTAFEEYALVAYGVFLVIGGLFLANGIAGYTTRLIARHRGEPPPRTLPAAVDAIPAVVAPPLVIEDLVKAFGGLQAVDGVTFTARPGEVTALIGPNGSGKTTVLNMVCGYYPPDDGEVRLGSDRLSGRGPHDVARMRVARTFQTPLVPDDLTVLEVVMTGLQGRRRKPFAPAALRLPSHRRRIEAEQDAALAVLEAMGMAEHADAPGSALALGTRRMIELARAVVGEPAVVLLDEVASGLDEGEIAQLSDIVVRLRAAGTVIVLVEHNFTFVKALADQIVVLADGRVLAQGTPAEVEADSAVVSTYLGEGAAITGTRTSSQRSQSAQNDEVKT